jgi:molecular chaperone GrpE
VEQDRPQPDEVEPDQVEPAIASEASGESRAQPGEQDPDAERERDEYLELAQRTQADLENYRKRAAKDLAAAGERAKAGLVRELLPVVDNLERALASAGEGEQHLAEGVRLVHSELVALLERNGIESFDPSGESFDPTFHEAISTRAQDGTDSGLVLDTVEKGYKLNGTVLRPARVVVSE